MSDEFFYFLIFTEYRNAPYKRIGKSAIEVLEIWNEKKHYPPTHIIQAKLDDKGKYIPDENGDKWEAK